MNLLYFMNFSVRNKSEINIEYNILLIKVYFRKITFQFIELYEGNELITMFKLCERKEYTVKQDILFRYLFPVDLF